MKTIKAGSEFDEIDAVAEAQKFAPVAHALFTKNGWTYAKSLLSLFEPFDGNNFYVPSEKELADHMIYLYQGWKESPTNYGRSSGRIRFEPRKNGRFRFTVYEE